MQLTIITNRTNQQINNLLAGQRIVGCTDNTLHLAGGRTFTITNSGCGIVNRDETQNGNQKQKECSNMNRNEPLYELSAWDWSGAHERFFDQHFVGKRLSNDPYAKSHHYLPPT